MTFASVDGIKMLLYMTRRTTQNFINIYPILAFISPREILFSLTCYDVQFQKGDICAILFWKKGGICAILLHLPYAS